MVLFLPNLGAACVAILLSQLPTADRILVSDTRVGCFEFSEVKAEYSRVEGGYAYRGKLIPVSLLGEIRRTLLATEKDPSSPDALLDEMGVTPAAVASHREDLLDASLPMTDTPRAVPASLAHLLEYEEVRGAALKAVSRKIGCTTRPDVRVMLPGTPAVTVRSDNLRPWMVPWTIEADGRTWETYSLAVPRSLRVLVPSEGPNASLLDGTSYWREGFWIDSEIWDHRIGDALVEHHARALLRDLEGAATGEARFRVKEATKGHINFRPYSIFVRLESVSPELVDTVWWFNPIVEGRPTATWNDLLRAYDECSRTATRHPWLSDWKGAGPGRTVELEVVGSRGFDDADVLPAWRDAGLEGSPEWTLRLRRLDHTTTDVHLGPRSSRSLITSTKKTGGPHPLDQRQVFFHPEEPEYLVAGPDGTFKRRRIR